MTLSIRGVGALTTREIEDLATLATTADHELIIRMVATQCDPPKRQRDATPKWNIGPLCANKEALRGAGEHRHELNEGRALASA